MNPLSSRKARFGANGDPLVGDPCGFTGPYGATNAYSQCNTACGPPTVLGNAGIPGCGTGTLPGTECRLKVLFRRTDGPIAPLGSAGVEILAGRAGAYKPRAMYIVGISSDDPSINARVEIYNITVMGYPQLVSFDGTTVVGNRGISDFYNLQCMPQPVDFAVFGASAGQGLIITFGNPDTVVSVIVYVGLWGDAADCSLIGRQVV